MKIHLPIVLAILTFITSEVTSLQCYQCDINPQYNGTKRLCDQFDYSDKFIVDCPHSTMCMKREIELVIPTQRIVGVIRDCAQQREQYRVYKGGQWLPKSEVKEPYQEGCAKVDDKGERTPSSIHCYCRGNLCNSSPKTNQETTYTDLMGVIVVFNLMKFIRSLRLDEA